MNLNGHNNEYIVLIGEARYNPASHYQVCKHRYTSVKDARRYAECFSNVSIFKLHWSDDWDVPSISRVPLYPEKRRNSNVN